MVSIESKKEHNPMEEIIKETKEEVNEVKNEVEQGNRPWKVNYIGESQDWNFNIYKYEVAQWGTKWWIKDKYINQIWPWVEWTQFTDAWWRSINKNKFDTWEIVYLRVPKKKNNNEQHEKQNTPWRIEYIWNKKDKKNKNWKQYSYTFVQGGTIEWVDDKRIAKFKDNIHDHLYRFYCDKNWNKLNKKRFNKWETIYIREPNIDIIDPTPDMTINEIMSISDNDLKNILYECDTYKNYELSNKHRDKLWEFIKINGKKVYILNALGSQNNNNLSNTKACIDYTTHETTYISIIKKVWNNYRWISWGNTWDDRVYRWNFKKYWSSGDSRITFWHD